MEISDTGPIMCGVGYIGARRRVFSVESSSVGQLVVAVRSSGRAEGLCQGRWRCVLLMDVAVVLCKTINKELVPC